MTEGGLKPSEAIAVIASNGGTVIGPEISRALKIVIETAAKEWIEAENETDRADQMTKQCTIDSFEVP